jgi:hypothetical protein
MVAVERTIRPGVTKSQHKAGLCRACGGSGIVIYWNEISFFEDRRVCSECEAGRKTDAKMAEILDKAMREIRFVRR